jgi:hypothetical protein
VGAEAGTGMALGSSVQTTVLGSTAPSGPPSGFRKDFRYLSTTVLVCSGVEMGKEIIAKPHFSTNC